MIDIVAPCRLLCSRLQRCRVKIQIFAQDPCHAPSLSGNTHGGSSPLLFQTTVPLDDIPPHHRPYPCAVTVPAVLLLGVSKSGFGAGFGSLAVPIVVMCCANCYTKDSE